jgi:L-lactate dehydrogenase complex protein LldG
MNTRETVLSRIRAALADVPAAEACDPDSIAAVTPVPGSVERFAERAAEYRAEVVRVPDDPGEIMGAIARACARHGARRLLVPEGLPGAWLPEQLELLPDLAGAPLDRDVLTTADGVITTCAAAIAETGTIVLDAGPGQGRRAVTLVPDLHVCVVPAGQVLAGVADAIAALQPGAGPVSPVTYISGPSATSDIELNRVEGVHGPRRLEIIVAG